MKTKTKAKKIGNRKKNDNPFFLSNISSGFFKVQPKLTTGKPGDKYETEADNIADKVVNRTQNMNHSFTDSGSNSSIQQKSEQLVQEKPLAESITPFVQRQEEEEEIQPKRIDIQKQEEEELEPVQAQVEVEEPVQAQSEKKGEEEPLQLTAENEEEKVQAQSQENEKEEPVQIQANPEEEEVQAKSGGESSATPSTETKVASSKGGGRKIDPATKKLMESSFGTDFSNVNIHTGADAVQMNQELGAQAFTKGKDVYFNKDKYDTNSNSGKHLLAHELTHTVQQTTPSPIIQKQEGEESNLDRLNEMLDRWNVPEEEVISICSELNEREISTVRTNATYKTRMANAFNVGEMVRAVNSLGFSLETKLNWVKAAATFGTTFIDYSEIKAMVTGAPQTERDILKTSTTAGKSFFVGVCTDETMVEALNDLQFDLITKLTWLKAEMIITSWELSYSTIQPWIVHANTTQAERDSLKINTVVGMDFFVDVCTNATMVRALDDLQFDLITKLTWLKAEMTVTSWELSYPTIQPWIVHANTTQSERDSLKTNTIVGMGFFVDVCTNATMVRALDDLQFDLITKLTWLKAEMTITSWELNYITIKPWIIHPNTTQAERDALKTETWKEFFINVCTNVTIIDAVTDLQFDLKTKIEWVRTVAGLEEVKQVIELATLADRDILWNDATYLNTLRSEVGDDYYLWVIVKLRMLYVGTVSHTSALDADAAIQAHLAAYVVGGVAAGRQIEGFVAVVDTTNWNIAGEHHYGASVWATKSINGFVDSAGRVWIEQNSGNPGTMVHEATHKYSSDQLIGVSQPLNEGVTEYFTRLVCNADGINIAGRNNYPNNWTTATKLVTLVGEAIVANAYFDGDMETLENTFVAAKSASDWTNFIAKTNTNDWADADGYL